MSPNAVTDFSAQAHAQTKALLTLREWIVSGQLAGGERISEMRLVERLGVSRTPVRAALQRLEQEGLLEALVHGGYVVRAFTLQDMADAIELRGLLEGLGVRWAAERGVSEAILHEAKATLGSLDELFERTSQDFDLTAYGQWNADFHKQLMTMAGSPVLLREYQRAQALPFASPSALVLGEAGADHQRSRFVVAQAQHWQVLDAIERRQGARAEALMREHAMIAQHNLTDSAPVGESVALSHVAGAPARRIFHSSM